MKRTLLLFLILPLILTGCKTKESTAQIATTTQPVYEFTTALCAGTGLRVCQLVTENVSCLHDYTLQVSQMRAIEKAEVIVISGAGLEDFLIDSINYSTTQIDASYGIETFHCEEHNHEHTDHDHFHEIDPHIWLSPTNAMIMAENICNGLKKQYPEHSSVFDYNLSELLEQLEKLQAYGNQTLSQLQCRELITFHDGFAYFADAFDLAILKAVEEESGSEASASEIVALVNLVYEYQLPAIFTESNGNTSAATIIAAETGIPIFQLDMALSGNSYFETMYCNINTIKEAMG